MVKINKLCIKLMKYVLIFCIRLVVETFKLISKLIWISSKYVIKKIKNSIGAI
jgi:hypothetical protein